MSDDAFSGSDFTGLERRILGALAGSESPVSWWEIIETIYPDADHRPSEGVVRVKICTLRKKLKALPYRIETVWGRGYRLIQT
jgi:DNA-binding response OmpR family regulator